MPVPMVLKQIVVWCVQRAWLPPRAAPWQGRKGDNSVSESREELVVRPGLSPAYCSAWVLLAQKRFGEDWLPSPARVMQAPKEA